MTRTKKPKLPTHYQSDVLAQIARSRLIKTRTPERGVPLLWEIAGIGEISHECAQALIRNQWVIPQRDGMSMFDETKAYLAKKP